MTCRFISPTPAKAHRRPTGGDPSPVCESLK